MMKRNDNEAAMIASILAGDTRLYHDLIRPHERSVYMMALSFTKNEADAEDIAQEAFLKAFRNLSTFRAESKFSTWLISITLNEARSRLRRQAIVRMESLDGPPDDGGSYISGFAPRLARNSFGSCGAAGDLPDASGSGDQPPRNLPPDLSVARC
jgi:DNA-directed RNA polymerase specialized sigma24 family protein